MYKVHIWNRREGLTSHAEQSVCSMVISKELAEKITGLTVDVLPMISELSYFGYDLYSSAQINELSVESDDILQLLPEFEVGIRDIVGLLDRAELMDMDILFDPFSQ